ncbi:MAG: bifunctional metallophosphatase/5'-nucleotidase [Candidatus Obscuribacterales bacterium]|nr:bifunctional metallophosphatase/5'-nucleotidase [Candidatus Obscuribacterales bacterium]
MEKPESEKPSKLTSLELNRKLLDDSVPDKNVWLKQAASEFGGTIAATIAGAASWSLIDRSKYGIAGKVLVTAVGSGFTKFTVKGGMETALLKSEDRTISAKDLAWGAVDGFAGVAASKAEAKIAENLTKNLGFKYAGKTLGPEQAFEVGSKVLDSSLRERMLSHALRGTSGGFVGSGVWSTAHALHEHRNELTSAQGIGKVARDIAINTAIGTAFGLGLSTGISGIANAREIGAYAKASLQGERGITRVDLLHFNDMHSALLGQEASLPQLASKASMLREQSKSAGRNPLLFELGDNYSGNVVAGSTRLGYVETKAIEMMKPNGTVPGNHVADVGLGNVDVDGWVKNIRQLAAETNREMPAVMTNIELPAHPGLVGKDGVYKPYRVIEINGTQGNDKVGIIGLVTKELEDMAEGAVIYRDAQESARKAITELNAQGVNKVIVLSHLGRAEDIALAQNVKGISAILGAHSHDIEPLPFWIKNAQNGAEVPISQAGSKAQWLGEMNLAFKADGSVDKFRSGGKLHEIHSAIKPDPEIRNYIQSEIGDIAKLENVTYQVQIKEPISTHGLRGQTGEQTPLGTLISRALLEQTNAQLPQINAARQASGLAPINQVGIVLKHTGDIKEGFTPGATNHLKLSNTFLNTGSVERELNELTVATMTGAQIKGALNFAVHDLPPAATQPKAIPDRIKDNARRFFSESPKPEFYDYTGNFVQTEGLRYSFDRSLPPGQRITAVEVVNPSTGKYVPIEADKSYEVLTLFHPVEKWGKRGIITNDPKDPRFLQPENWAYGKQHTASEARTLVGAQAIRLSQVDLLAKYLVDKGSIKNGDFKASNNIRDLTPKPWQPEVRPGIYSTIPLAFQNGQNVKEK